MPKNEKNNIFNKIHGQSKYPKNNRISYGWFVNGKDHSSKSIVNILEQRNETSIAKKASPIR